jgi:hypothetical protein
MKEFPSLIPSLKHEFYHTQLISIKYEETGKFRTKKHTTHHMTYVD